MTAGMFKGSHPPRVIGGRYGPSSKEFTPAMVKGVCDEMGSALAWHPFSVMLSEAKHPLRWHPFSVMLREAKHPSRRPKGILRPLRGLRMVKHQLACT